MTTGDNVLEALVRRFSAHILEPTQAVLDKRFFDVFSSSVAFRVRIKGRRIGGTQSASDIVSNTEPKSVNFCVI
jgi:hypothetical protein